MVIFDKISFQNQRPAVAILGLSAGAEKTRQGAKRWRSGVLFLDKIQRITFKMAKKLYRKRNANKATQARVAKRKASELNPQLDRQAVEVAEVANTMLSLASAPNKRRKLNADDESNESTPVASSRSAADMPSTMLGIRNEATTENTQFKGNWLEIFENGEISARFVPYMEVIQIYYFCLSNKSSYAKKIRMLEEKIKYCTKNKYQWQKAPAESSAAKTGAATSNHEKEGTLDMEIVPKQHGSASNVHCALARLNDLLARNNVQQGAPWPKNVQSEVGMWLISDIILPHFDKTALRELGDQLVEKLRGKRLKQLEKDLKEMGEDIPIVIPRKQHQELQDPRQKNARIKTVNNILHAVSRGDAYNLVLDIVKSNRWGPDLVRDLGYNITDRRTTQSVYQPLEMIGLLSSCNAMTQKLVKILHWAAPHVFPKPKQVERAKAALLQDFSLTMRKKDDRVTLVWADMLAVVYSHLCAVCAAENIVLDEVAMFKLRGLLGLDGFTKNIYGHNYATQTQLSHRTQGGLNVTDIEIIFKDPQRQSRIVAVSNVQSRLVGRPLFILEGKESDQAVLELMDIQNQVIRQLQQGVLVKGVAIMADLWFTADEKAKRMAYSMLGCGSSWISYHFQTDRGFAPSLERIHLEIDLRRTLPVMILQGRIAQQARAQGLSLLQIDRILVETLAEYPELHNAPQTLQLIRFLDYIRPWAMQQQHERPLFAIQLKARTEEHGKKKKQRVIHEWLVKGELPKVQRVWLSTWLAGMIDVPKYHICPWKSQPGLCHMDLNIGKTLQQVLQHTARRLQVTQRVKQRFETLKMSECLGVMQGNHVRHLLGRTEEWSPVFPAGPAKENMLTVFSLYAKFRYVGRKTAPTMEQRLAAATHCWKFGELLNEAYDFSWRNYVYAAVAVLPYYLVKPSHSLARTSEDWNEGMIQTILTAKTSKGGGKPTAANNQSELKQQMKNLYIRSHPSIMTAKVKAVLERPKQGCDNCGGLGHKTPTCGIQSVRFYIYPTPSEPNTAWFRRSSRSRRLLQ